MLEKSILTELYIEKGLSMMQISKELSCSPNKVAYWMEQHDIKRRSISDAVYRKNHPDGDPFTVQPVDTPEKAKLFGLGIGLYWGEGTKASMHSVR